MNFVEFKNDWLASFPTATQQEVLQAWRESGFAPAPQVPQQPGAPRHLILGILAGQYEQSQIVKQFNWKVSGSVINSLSVKGVRSRLYRNADNYLGYYEDAHPALYYDGDTLNIHILFKTEDNALHFESQLRQEAVTFNSSMKSLEIISAVSFSDSLQLGGRIYYMDYIPTESESPQDTDSLISTQFSTFDSTSDEFKFQRIEKLSIFGSKGKAESAHVMDGAQCRKFPSLNKYDKDRSNRLALSRDLHGWFDHLNTSVPLFYVKVICYSDSQVLEDRHELKLAIHALDNEAADMIFPRLNEGSVQTNDPLLMNTTIYVVNPVIFQKCAEWKEKVIRKSWDVYNNMKPAVE